jgi:hypothetical protein
VQKTKGLCEKPNDQSKAPVVGEIKTKGRLPAVVARFQKQMQWARGAPSRRSNRPVVLFPSPAGATKAVSLVLFFDPPSAGPFESTPQADSNGKRA